jgi:hypothetical protein
MCISNPWLNSVVFGELLAVAGEPIAEGLWQRAIYLGPDEVIYEMEAQREGEDIVLTLTRRQSIADYLRFIARKIGAIGGALDPSDCHHSATLKLAELFWAKEAAPGRFV